MTFLILTLGFSPMASVWAGGMSSSEHSSPEQGEITIGSVHDHAAMQQTAASDDVDAAQANFAHYKHCNMDCCNDCDSSCSSGVCNTCGHCAAALINIAIAIPAKQAYLSPLSAIYTLESREFTPPFRPPLSTL